MSEKLDILIFGAHADDAEIGMAGTIAKHTAAGLSVGICDLTQAELSSNGTVSLRKEEAAAAAEVLNLTVRTNLGLPDRGLFVTPEHVERVTEVIRKHAPSIVFAPYWEDRHPDHVACSRLVEEAVFNAKLRRYMPDQPAVKVDGLYFYYINDMGQADLIVDVTDVYDIKEQALSCYRSQFEKSADDAVSTPLTEGYIERVRARDALLGGRKLIPYAEGFATKSPYEVHLFGF
ncbi:MULTISPECIES: bacillithiol biosynthesis deacetylase BshB1 [Paenibacillus]|uniref:Bacillithiol biosynthesis deacetylase BshB1 n=1 Tax=Paenibacillus campinasensis TaxID=66347 RepID=A0A268F336_9BACL|nr:MULTISPECIES: bacillithiol biosynthesis deacetylase BshB1 [Paenibacillus]MUG65035.1 bacillithiol biosynthesis deacetylase BshB1 [Paenibacillus campinasensis]PAD79744.1 bacillithiol biosynthesis deacetylase BshB1 [Paenibacillus campinasensis]PAK53608.1 bacillithiol biosynthesis deacetylase BshB1 [Paenibacillus sp. 7541]